MSDPSPASEGAVTLTRQAYRGLRPGGRAARVRQSVMEALLTELMEVGYEAMTLASIARRAGVAASTVRRRWPGKPELLLDMGTQMTEGLVPDPQGETLREDLDVLARSVAAMLREPLIITVLQAVFALPEGPLDELRQSFWAERRLVADAIVERAVARGEARPGTPGWEIVEAVHATIWMRLLITGMPVDDAVIERAVEHGLHQAAQPIAPGRTERDDAQ